MPARRASRASEVPCGCSEVVGCEQFVARDPGLVARLRSTEVQRGGPAPGAHVPELPSAEAGFKPAARREACRALRGIATSAHPFAFPLFSGSARGYGEPVQTHKTPKGASAFHSVMHPSSRRRFRAVRGPGNEPGLCAYRSIRPRKTQRRDARPPRMRSNDPRRRGGHRQR